MIDTKWEEIPLLLNIHGKSSLHLSGIFNSVSYMGQIKYTREIISCDISKHPNYEQISNMLTIIFQKYPHTKVLIFHSNQGWAY